jgi:hypothetical protein
MPHQAARNSAYVNCEVHWNFTSENMRLLDTVTITAVTINLKNSFMLLHDTLIYLPLMGTI